MKKENNIKKFLNKKSFLNLRLNQEVLEDGIAYIPCYVENIEDIPEEFFYVVFWLFADSLVRYIFIERGDYRDKRIGAGRIASMKVEFVEDEEM